MPAHGWLWLDDVEVLNDNRSLAYLNCHLGELTITEWDTPCAGFDKDPTDSWNDLDYTDVTTAPWYSANHPQSEEFLGFYTTEFTFDGTAERSVSERGLVRGGANVGRLHRKQREMALEVVLLASSDEGMRWGFDWLDAQLAGATCTPATALIRLSCPTDSPPVDGLWELHEVGILDPMEWQDGPLNRAGCTIRPVSFSLVAGDPCRYAPESEIETLVNADTMALDTGGDCLTASTQVDFACPTEGLPNQRICAEITAPFIGQNDVNILIEAGSEGSAATVVRGAYDPAAAGCADATLDVFAQAVVCRLGADERVLIDSSARRIWFDDGSGTWVDGSDKVYLGGSSLPYFFSFVGSTDGWVWIEPANLVGHSTLTEFTVTTRLKVCA